MSGAESLSENWGIVVPALDEEKSIGSTLEPLLAWCDGPVLVVDGGSKDETLALAESAGARVISSQQQGRAAQMNEGAAEIDCENLLFVHADTRVKPETLDAMATAMQDHPDYLGGGFERYFDSPSSWLLWTSRVAWTRSRRTGLILGDQGIFARRSAFEEAGGFSESFGQGEDIDFSLKLRRLGPTVLIGPPVLSSPRRFEKRLLRRSLADAALTLKLVARHKWRLWRKL
ncbi:MAG: glycosyltransferase family 2 protein [Verrucomicrobiota bacterium]